MLRSVKTLEGYKVSATDGDIGSVRDFYFDDEYWTIRYLVVDTGGFWQGPREVLISPIAFREADWSAKLFNLALTGEKVKDSPSTSSDRPVSRQYERNYYQYYGWSPYWGYGGIWGTSQYPEALATPSGSEPGEQATGDAHLRSAGEVTGYTIQGSDDEIGHVKDFLVDDRTWTIRYLVVNTSNWWFGKNVLLAPHWIDRISWEESNVHVNLPREAIKKSPEWKPDQPIDREYERSLYAFYDRPAYWSDKEGE